MNMLLKYAHIEATARFKLFGALKALYPELVVYNLPMNFFYPIKYFRLDKLFEKKITLPGCCYGIHWYGGHEKSQEWVNILTPDNFNDHSTTMCRALKGVWDG